ncbi:hypothetical protein [Bauldia sp.]|uniref:hypothetical protein n=1 Tax=Bauldia sp. TaxID=2575872 RepID=UPI003BAA6DC5
MPTIARFLTILVLIAAVVFAAMFYLGNFVEPRTREMTVRIPASRLDPVPIIRPTPEPPPPEAVAADTDAAEPPAQ